MQIQSDRWFWCDGCETQAIRCERCKNSSCNSSGCNHCQEEFEFAKNTSEKPTEAQLRTLGKVWEDPLDAMLMRRR